MHGSPVNVLACQVGARQIRTATSAWHVRPLLFTPLVGSLLRAVLPSSRIQPVAAQPETLSALQSSDASAAASAIVQSTSTGSATAAGAALAEAAASGNTQAVAQATATAAAQNVGSTATVLAAAATQAYAKGATDAFATSTAKAFAAAESQGSTQALTQAYAQVSHCCSHPIMSGCRKGCLTASSCMCVVLGSDRQL